VKSRLLIPSLLMLGLAFLPLPAQNNSQRQQRSVTPRVSGYGPRVHLAAQSLQQNSEVIFLQGNVEINLSDYVMLADDAEYHLDTGEIQARGGIHLKPVPAVDSRGVTQFGIK
jgi:lipopolysaccharide assembly outer membrane protein LptD (OstA)